MHNRRMLIDICNTDKNLNIVICLSLVGDEWKSSFELYRRIYLIVEHTVCRQLVKAQLYVNDSVFEVDFGPESKLVRFVS